MLTLRKTVGTPKMRSRDSMLPQHHFSSRGGSRMVESWLFTGNHHLIVATTRRCCFSASHVRVVRALSALRHLPDDVLRRVLDVACLTMDAVLMVDLKALSSR